jgi:hypothetical protein
MKISRPQLLQKGEDLFYSVRVSSSAGEDTLWFSVKKEFAPLVSEQADAALLSLLIPAMTLGEEIHIEGALSQKLFYSFSGPYQHILRKIIPSLSFVKIYPTELDSFHREPDGVGMGFSAGIDSFCALADHHDSDVSPGFGITHLLFNNVGSHGHGKRAESLFIERCSRVRQVASRVGLPLVVINSNMDQFYKGVCFQQTHTPRNASVALLLQNGIGKFLYASAFPYQDIFIGPAASMAYSDMITLPLLSTETLDAISVGSQYNRVEKTLRVAEIKESYEYLDVCFSGRNSSRNCSTCRKCMRTILTLEIAGLADRYSRVFDYEEYQKRRIFFMARVLKSKDPFLREIVEFAKERDFVFPLSARLLAQSNIRDIAERTMRLLPCIGVGWLGRDLVPLPQNGNSETGNTSG